MSERGEQPESDRTDPSDPSEAAQPNLGTCCACGTDQRVRNIMTLQVRAPEPGTGWGCMVCHLPSDGAVAILCDGCHESNARIVEVCAGFPQQGRRVPIDGLNAAPFDHDKRYHPETWTWFGDDTKREDRTCSLCGMPIDDDEVPFIIWQGKGRNTREARFHIACSPVGKGLTAI